jgi:hypothetical protein
MFNKVEDVRQGEKGVFPIEKGMFVDFKVQIMG